MVPAYLAGIGTEPGGSACSSWTGAFQIFYNGTTSTTGGTWMATKGYKTNFYNTVFITGSMGIGVANTLIKLQIHEPAKSTNWYLRKTNGDTGSAVDKGIFLGVTL